MLAYLSETKERLTLLKAGMVKYPDNWTAQTVEIQSITDAITAIDAKDAEVEEAKQRHSILLAEGRQLNNNFKKLINKTENFAIGYHADNAEKLIEYGIKSKKAPTPRPAPSRVLIPGITDDTDGEGFIIIVQTDSDADYYEWLKGTGADPADLNTIPELKPFKTTTKTTFVDDDVARGIRYFYKVRAANSNGTGPWSEAVSRVQ